MPKARQDRRNLAFVRVCRDNGVSVDILATEDVPLGHVRIGYTDGLMQVLWARKRADVVRARGGTHGPNVCADGIPVDAI